MGYFDGITQAAFNKDERGRHLYFPNGKIGKGYVMHNDEEYEHFVAFHKKRMMVLLILPLTLVVMGAKLTVIAGVFVVLALVDWLWTGHRTKGLERTPNKFDITQAAERSTRSLGLPLLVFFQIVSVLLVLLGLLTTFAADSTGFLLCGIALTVSGGFMVWRYTKRINLVRKK